MCHYNVSDSDEKFDEKYSSLQYDDSRRFVQNFNMLRVMLQNTPNSNIRKIQE